MISRLEHACRGPLSSGRRGFRWSDVSNSSGPIIWQLRTRRARNCQFKRLVMPMIELQHIRKNFASVRAVNDVSLTIGPGTVHGVLGENGAGKTTLMNILYGIVQRDGGEIRIDGRPAEIHSPREAIRQGIGMVHQHFMLAGAMNVIDNVLLGDRREEMFLNRKLA